MWTCSSDTEDSTAHHLYHLYTVDVDVKKLGNTNIDSKWLSVHIEDSLCVSWLHNWFLWFLWFLFWFQRPADTLPKENKLTALPQNELFWYLAYCLAPPTGLLYLFEYLQMRQTVVENIC